MVLTLTTTTRPASDLGFLLHKNPSRVHSQDVGYGMAHVVYPEATEERCTAALVLEIDPVSLVRGRGGPKGDGGRFDQYVNDRPYALSSFMSVALGRLFGTAMTGRSKERQDLADSDLDLEIRMPALPSRGGEPLLRTLFEPLGYEVAATPIALSARFPQWGPSAYFDVTLKAKARLRDSLAHLYVLIPVLDDEKHYWVGSDEVEKLLRRGQGWLESHPAKEEIVKRYLMRQRVLTRDALARLSVQDGDPDPDEREQVASQIEEAVERPLSLHEARLHEVLRVLKESGARSVLDLGCGEGKLLELLLKDKQFESVVGMDVSLAILERAERRLKVDRLPSRVAERLKLIHGSVVYRDSRLSGFDAAAIIEVIEHLDLHRLASLQKIVFEFSRPKIVVVTTPNREYNALFPTMIPGQMRHRDHRFEWTRAEFSAWAHGVASSTGYDVEFGGIGPTNEEFGSPTQMAVFSR